MWVAANSNIENPFQKLQVLDVSHNAFVGTLPDRYFRNFRGMIDANEKQTGEENFFLRYIELTLTLKGIDQLLKRLLYIFTTIDLSSNNFSGSIPPSIGDLKSLKYLNLSHNILTGHIPSSLGGMSELESLDLSSNKLDGKIPREFASMTFLAKLNLSMNNLEGQIPLSTQLSTFGNESYVGNVGLCGFPLTQNCGRGDKKQLFPQEEGDDDDAYVFVNGFGWQSVVTGYGCGFVVGIGIGYMVIRSGRPRWLLEFFFGVGYNNSKMKRRNRAKATTRRR
ncbi:receptor-like protein 9DC3 [Salvia hispanica]|uniref:receptor-like protein 9DC3 n=1 Tax=Salvia hispanica TaxID=49212 RepID=UPI0020095ED7|nr:receptor-like protein 9DC3 [Salvia hispanica]